ncbi:hypothetical protein ABMA28_014352 [Loxostege sticticalis]|uniref:Uncharacterized protein n=1 Tax=Loxostege sticticalis TaxID=481309 RepID=A0ABD0TGH0_LOXSC
MKTQVTIYNMAPLPHCRQKPNLEGHRKTATLKARAVSPKSVVIRALVMCLELTMFCTRQYLVLDEDSSNNIEHGAITLLPTKARSGGPSEDVAQSESS